MKLIIATPSPYARKVRVILREKNIDFEEIIDVPWNTDTLTLGVNPLGKIPILLRDDNEPLFDSKVIVQYLDGYKPKPLFYPNDYSENISARLIETVSDGGILAGFPMIDYKVTILDGLHHDVDSSVLAFELASRQCFKEACTRATLKLLEPMMRVEVVTPEDYMGDVIGDLNSRRGQISTQEQRGNATVITAMVPLANMFGYINSLRSMSQGRAQYSMFFDHYAKVPQNVQDEVTKKTG